MAKKKEGSGLMSSAGLMRYYDAEETAIIIEPKTVVYIAVVLGLAVYFAPYIVQKIGIL